MAGMIACLFYLLSVNILRAIVPSGTMLVPGTLMQNHFEIDYQGKKVAVDYQPNKKEDEYLFTLHLPDGPWKLQCQKDNEGAYKWLEEDDSASEKATDAGLAIEKYLVENGINL